MRVMVMVKATPRSEAGELPTEKLMTDMGKFNEELMKAGIIKAGEGLKPSSEAVRGSVFGIKPDRHRRSLRRDQGTGRGVLDLGSRFDGGSRRLGQALPESDAGGFRY